MSEKTVLWEASEGVGRITLNRPQTLNAWIAEFGAELRDIVTGPAAEPDVRAVLITGAGRGFSSGADLKAGFDPHPEDGRPDVKKELHEVYHPAIAGIRRRISSRSTHRASSPTARCIAMRSRAARSPRAVVARITYPRCMKPESVS